MDLNIVRNDFSTSSASLKKKKNSNSKFGVKTQLLFGILKTNNR